VIPLLFVIFQLAVLAWAFIAQIRDHPSPVFKGLWLAAIGGVIGMDVWYLSNFAYPDGFAV
jgi:hypothetical protein